MKKKIRVGVIGVGRGSMMWHYCKKAENAVIVAICDQWQEGLRRAEKELNDPDIAYYTDYQQFLAHDMDVVMLANYANEHAPFAIAAMEAGKHVISEVLPAQNLSQAVALIECVERTGKKYCYAENYCFMNGPREMRRRYRAGDIGEIEYAEGEYIHNCEPIWTDITYGQADHWRNNMYTFFYCTHSLGPILHITGLRPVKVMGFEIPPNSRSARMGKKGGIAGVEMVTLENGAVVKSAHGDLDKNSIWYTLYGRKGRMETAREDALQDGYDRLYVNADPEDGQWDDGVENYKPGEKDGKSETFGHGGSDYHCLFNAIEYMRGNGDADVIDVYEAIDMWLPGLFAHFSVLEGGLQQTIPDLRKPDIRDRYRHDTRCTDPKAAGDQLVPCCSMGNIKMDADVYDRHREKWLKHLEEK